MLFLLCDGGHVKMPCMLDSFGRQSWFLWVTTLQHGVKFQVAEHTSMFSYLQVHVQVYLHTYIHSYIKFMHLHMFAHAMFWLTFSFHTKTSDVLPSKVHGSDTTGGSLQYLQPNSRCRSKLLGEDHLRSAKMHRKSVHIYIYIHAYLCTYLYMCIHACCMYTYIYV